MNLIPISKVSSAGLYFLKHRRMGWNYVGEAVDGSFPWVDEDILRGCDEAFGPLPSPDELLAMHRVCDAARGIDDVFSLAADSTWKQRLRKALTDLEKARKGDTDGHDACGSD